MAKKGKAPTKPPVVEWPRAQELRAFREEYGLTKQAMVNLLNHYGMPTVNWATYHHWDKGDITPRPLYEAAIFRALAAARRKLEADRETK